MKRAVAVLYVARGHAESALALEQSDNAAAESLFSRLEQIHGGLDGASIAVQDALERAGDRRAPGIDGARR